MFDDPNLVSSAGLVPVLALAERAGLRELVDAHLSLPTDRGANAGLKVASLVGGMVAGADSIDDMAVLRHGGMGRLFARIYAPSTVGSFLRAFTFGHIRQLDAVAARFLLTLAKLAGLFAAWPVSGHSGAGTYALVDVDDTVVEVHGHAKQGAGFGYNRIRGLNALLATLTTNAEPGSTSSGPLIVAQRLRKGACNSSRGAKRLVADATKTARRLLGRDQLVLVRLDSAFYERGPVHAASAGGAAVSVTVRMTTSGGAQLHRTRVLATVNWSVTGQGRRLHDLRHTAACLWLARGVEPGTVQAWMGRESIATTNRYLHFLGTSADLAGLDRLNQSPESRGYAGGTRRTSDGEEQR